jgi:cell division protein FtsZ
MKSSKSKDRFRPLSANVKVIGVGGGGGNAVARMARNFLKGVDFIAINTDHQDLDHCAVRHKIYIGKGLTKGLGTGMNPDLGRQAAEENRSEISEVVKGADLVFIAAGLGGGTGSGGGPVIAEAAKQAGALTIAVVTKPFSFEGSQRERIAAEALMKLRDKVDALIVVPNDRIFTVISKDTPVIKAFEAIDDILRKALKSIVEIIAMPGIINVDFADVKNIMQDAGITIIGVGVASGADRAVQAVNQALHSPLLETSPEGAKAVLLGISGGRDLKMNEVNEAAKIVAQTADPGARIIFGAYHDKNLKAGQLKVTIVAAGFNGNQATALFGAGGHFGERQNMFSRPAPVLENPAKRPQGQRDAAMGSASMQKEASSRADRSSDDEDTFSSSSSRSGSSVTAMNDKKEKEKERKEKESDAWDIPAFLRRRKR